MKRSDLFPSKYACADDLNGQRVPVTIDRIVLEDVEDDSMVPDTSLLREFIGGGAYDIH